MCTGIGMVVFFCYGIEEEGVFRAELALNVREYLMEMFGYLESIHS